jgi:SlyX protein
MNNPEEINDRIENLETKIMFQDELIEQLNQSLINQQSDIRKIALMVERLNSQVVDMQQPNIADASQESPPPHY